MENQTKYVSKYVCVNENGVPHENQDDVPQYAAVIPGYYIKDQRGVWQGKDSEFAEIAIQMGMPNSPVYFEWVEVTEK